MQFFCDPVDCSLPGSSVHGISQARILEWVAISFSRRTSQPRDQTHVSCIGRWFLYHSDIRKASRYIVLCDNQHLSDSDARGMIYGHRSDYKMKLVYSVDIMWFWSSKITHFKKKKQTVKVDDKDALMEIACYLSLCSHWPKVTDRNLVIL